MGHVHRAGLHVEHDVGHVPFVEATDVAARLVRGFLADVRRRAESTGTPATP